MMLVISPLTLFDPSLPFDRCGNFHRFE